MSQAGALDLDELSRLGTSDAVVNQLLGGTPEEVPHRYAEASPRRRLPIGVPLLLVHGARALESGHLLEHLYREVRAPRIYEGASEVQREIIARALFRAG